MCFPSSICVAMVIGIVSFRQSHLAEAIGSRCLCTIFSRLFCLVWGAERKRILVIVVRFSHLQKKKEMMIGVVPYLSVIGFSSHRDLFPIKPRHRILDSCFLFLIWHQTIGFYLFVICGRKSWFSNTCLKFQLTIRTIEAIRIPYQLSMKRIRMVRTTKWYQQKTTTTTTTTTTITPISQQQVVLAA